MGAAIARLLKKYSDRLDADSIDKDREGYWIGPKPGWYLCSMGSHLIHETSLKAVEAELKQLRPGCTCAQCTKGVER